MNGIERRSKPRSETNLLDDPRPAVISADATGLIAGEELITEAETILPTEMPKPKPKRQRRSPKPSSGK